MTRKRKSGKKGKPLAQKKEAQKRGGSTSSSTTQKEGAQKGDGSSSSSTTQKDGAQKRDDSTSSSTAQKEEGQKSDGSTSSSTTNKEGAQKRDGSTSSRLQKKGPQKRKGSTSSSRAHSRSRSKSKQTSYPSQARSRSHGQHNISTTESGPLSKEAQTQTSASLLVDKDTQTETVGQASQQTQTEINGNTETAEVSQPPQLSHEDVEMEGTVQPRTKGSESDGEKEESVKRKKRKVSEIGEPAKETEESTKLSHECGEKVGDNQKNEDTNKHYGGDSLKDLKSVTEEPKSYAAAAATGKTGKVSKEQTNQIEANQDSTMESKSTQRKPSPVRAPAGPPMLTFYIYAVLDKRFRFNEQYDSLFLDYKNGNIKLQMKHFNSIGKDGYLIEATFSVKDSAVRGGTIQYKYVVQQRQNQKSEIAVRYIEVPSYTTEKEFHLYEGYISCSSTVSITEWMMSLFHSEQKAVYKGWETSAHVLLDRIFLKWHPSNEESNMTFVQHLRSYKNAFESGCVEFPGNYTPFPIKVSELISAKLRMILKKESEALRTSESLDGVKSEALSVALSVFKVCCGCDVDLSLKDWGKLCQVVSECMGSFGEIQTTQTAPFINTVTGLMNLCAKKLITEVVLLVPVLHLLRNSEVKEAGPGSSMDEQRWTGLENISYQSFRERIRGLPDKRRMILKLIKDNLPMTKDNPKLLKSWLSLVAFEDVSEFVQLTGSFPELLIQSLMCRIIEAEKNTDANRTEKNLEVTGKVLNLLLKSIEKDRERIMKTEQLTLILQCCCNVHKSVCKTARLVPQYKVTVLSFQLLLKMAEIVYDGFFKGGEQMKQHQNEVLSKLNIIQEDFRKWRVELLLKPLMQTSGFTYPREMELWNDLYGIESSIPGVTERWKGFLDHDLRRRISQISDTDKIVVYVLVTSAKAVENSHANIQSCLKELCEAAIKNQCQAKKEGTLLCHLFSKTISWPVLSSIIVESAACFGEDHKGRLLDPQSAINFFLSQDKWNEWKLEDGASQLIAESQSFLGRLIQTLCQGSIPLGHLKTIFKYKTQFQKLYNQYKNNNKEMKVSISVSDLLSQREDDLKAFEQQKGYMTNLINMLGKISDVINVPELSSLEEIAKTNVQEVALDKLVEVETYFSKDDLKKNNTRRVLFYSDDQQVQDMARKMHDVNSSNLILSFWQEKAKDYFMAGPELLSLDLTEIYEDIWTPCLTKFLNFGNRIAVGQACFKEVEEALVGCGETGEGDRLKKEFMLMATMLDGHNENWPEQRLKQIREYRCLYDAAESAEVILKLKDRLGLQGDFSHIHSLTLVRDDSFKQNTLGSLSEDLIKARQKLADVERRHTTCLEAFLKSDTLIKWIKAEIPSLKELKVFMELATISAGENDADIDRLASFETAVMGYAPLLYSLPQNVGFEEFFDYAKQVLDTLNKDEKLGDKLVDSNRWLDWLKGLRETHGSVEQSSLSLASAINTGGMYHVGWPDDFNGKTGLDNIFYVKVTKNNEEKTYRLNELLELQNKLMLMSSKGEKGKEQVIKFTQVFEGIQRMGRILLQLHRSGNMLFRNWAAEITCNHQNQPCIQVKFPLLSKCIVYQGEVEEELQKLSRSLEDFHKDWCNHLTKMRSQYYPLNHYSSEQIVYLCEWINSINIKKKPVPQQVWHLLTPIKPDCMLNDIKEAFEIATEPQSILQEDTAEELGPNSDFDLPLSFSLLDVSTECLEDLWKQFKENMSGFLTHHVDVETLGRFLSNLSNMNQLHIKRKIPSFLQEGRPNLVQCPAAELMSTTLSFYMESPENPLPTTDEVLMCQEETTEEEVEIFLRRCLGGATSNHKKIYTLVNPGSLSYDVSVALVEYFETQEVCAGPYYRLVMVCPVNQDRYIPSFFSNYKVQTGITISAERSQKYIRHHFKISYELATHSSVYPERLSVWMIASKRPAVGKSLYVRRLFEKFKGEFPRATLLTIRLIDPYIDMDEFVQTLSERLAPLRQQDPVLLHIDVAAVCHGLEEFLFKLLILECISDSKGTIWRRNKAHLVVIETLQRGHKTQTKMEPSHGFLNTLPTIFCRPPKDIKEIMKTNESFRSLDPLMDKEEFESEDIQRPYQYLRRFNRSMNLDRFTYQAHSVEGDPVDCLHHLLSNYGLKDPSWAELKHFTWFLNLQLKDCEKSLFCDSDFCGETLSGFKDFIVKFMIHMARDFASPSIDISDQSPSFFSKNEDEEEILSFRKRWENESHPYIFFNADHVSMSFLGFHVKQNGTILNAVDSKSGKVLMRNVMTQELFSDIQRQMINLSKDFDDLTREDKLQKMSFVVGAEKGCEKGKFDPDPTYELTTDNVMKMLAIHMRFRCEIPVIIMGETGCGKTRLVRFLCDLQREGRDVENMKLVKVHGGTTSETIYKKVREAEELAQKNRQKYKLDTVLFFDEANTTEAIFAIKEVLCDKTVKGYPLKKNSGLKIIAACNPYRRHTTNMVDRLERAGLGYRVKAEETEDRLGKVPMRQLVYRVHPLPPSMVPLVWDFGQLSDSTELSYIRQIVKKKMRDHRLPLSCQNVITNVLAASQKYMRNQADECSFVSLRDVERSMGVLLWFYNHRDIFFPSLDFPRFENEQMVLKCLVLAVGVCYYPSLENKRPYLATISKCFPDQFNYEESLEQEIASCQDFLLKNIQTRETIAKNMALKENVFLMVVCIELRIPLFLVGKPGSSKSLAKTVIADAMQRQASHCDLFKKLKEVHMVSFQCSLHSSPEGIIGTFRNCARFQKDKNLDEYVSVVVLDEIGLAEDSPQMPLKTLHPLLEDGCIDSDNPESYMKVGFVGISNWALDPAKMNRGIFVSRWDPSEKDLVETAEGICSSSQPVLLKIKHLLSKLAKCFLSICKTDSEQFFGLRDYYGLIKMLFDTVKCSDQEPSDKELAEAVLRNFSGQRDGFDPLDYFKDIFQNIQNVQRPNTLNMIEQNLDHHIDKECRYLLLLTTNNAALYIIQHHIFSKENYTQKCPEIVFGSGFPKDQEYAQICRNVSRIKACMETGRTVILLNLLNLYESLYDALNQYYVYFSGQQYVDLGLGSHRVKCRVHRDFRLVVVEDQEKVYKKFPVPLKNRLEKHKVDRSTDLAPWQHRVLEKLKKWAREFSKIQHSDSSEANFSVTDAFVGFHGDACASALLQALKKIDKLHHNKEENREESEAHHIDREFTEFQEKVNKFPDEAQEDDASMEVDKVQDAEIDEEMETLGDDSDLVKMVEGPVFVETRDKIESNKTMDEEEVYEIAKSFLLNCSTPDSVLRLKYSEFGNQETEELQKMYFHLQTHQSLRDLLNNHLNKTNQDKNRFLEVTTFSNLLTGADVRNLAPALGLSTERFLLLSLHQFDTEASFCNKIQSFLRESGPSVHILLIQMDMEESLCKNELIASAKYCTMNEILHLKSDECNIYTVFITKLSRIGEQCTSITGDKYIGFQGGVWLSAHIDDLRDSDDLCLNLKAFCGIPISQLISQTIESDVKESDEMNTNRQQSEKGDSVHLHSLSLLRSCTQKAVSLLRDTDEKTSRSMERMNILLGLLACDPGRTGARFQQVLLKRLVFALIQKEELIPNAKDWVYKVAKNHEALQECGTLRHTLWRYLQDFLTPVLARILEVIDRDCNLYQLYGEGLSEGLTQFWLDIFEDQQLLDLIPSQNTRAPDQEINVQCHLFVGEVEQPCAAPYSWLIKTYCQSLWEESEFVRSSEQDIKARIQQFVSAVSGSRLGSYIQKLSDVENVELGQRYLTDYVLLAFKVNSEDEHWVLQSAVLGCVFTLQTMMSVSPELSPSWIHAAAQIYNPRMDTLSHVLQLNPQLVSLIQQERPKRESPDMCEDILAVGICVEETKLLPVTSLTECLTFLQRVEQLQPCIERVLSPDYSALCSPGCLKYLETIQSVWQGILLVAVFIEKVVIKMKKGDERIIALTLKHCSQLHGLVEGSPDFRSKDNLQQIIRILNDYHEESISSELRYGVKCRVCLMELSEPFALPCEHVFCRSCLRRSMEREEAQHCPVCREPLSNNYQPTVSTTLNFALKQHKEIIKCCNTFFLEVVSRFCLTDDQDPPDDLVELLFSLLISAQGDVYKTRELTPFLECVDQSPVVRSVLPKLLMQYSLKQVKKHIQSYLEDLENKLLDKEDRTELYRLFVNCFQDTLLCSDSNGDHKHLRENTNFLSRLARKQTPSRQNDPAEFLMSMARLRMCLDSAAYILSKAICQKNNFVEAEFKFMEQVKAVCDYCDNDWYRVYLLRALNRQAGMDFLQALINSTDYEWIFPAEMMRLHRLIPAEVDRFLCCGQSYRALRDGVGESTQVGTTDGLKEALQASVGSGPLKNALLTLAVFRQVTCRFMSPERTLHPQEQQISILEKVIRDNMSGHAREFCTALLSNHIGGPGSNLRLGTGVPAQRRPVLELLVHACTVFYSGNRLISPLFNIASQPQNMTGAFLPTMPDDHTSEAKQWLSEKKLKMYFCSNSHACFVGECGRPMAKSKCATCGVEIGGEGHIPVPGFTEAYGDYDRTRPGHILGQARTRSEAPNRKLTLAQSCVLRLCLHLAMLQGLIHYQQGIRNMIHPDVSDVYQFLWQHLEKDMEVLGKTLTLNIDDSAIVIHLIFSRFLQTTPVANVDLSTRKSREQWEITVCKTAISPVLQNLDRELNNAQDLIAADNRLSNSPLVKVLRGDPQRMLQLPANCPTEHSAFWSPSSVLTVESISQQIDQTQAPLLTLFVQKVHYIRQLDCLPALAALLSDLMKVLPPGSETQNHTIASLLHCIPAGHQKKLLSERVEIYMKVWNQLRMEISSNASLGLDSTHCEKDITSESSGQFLFPSRKGAGSCLHAVIDVLSETHNSLVREARKLCQQADSDYKVPLAVLSKSQLALCHPEREFLPLVLANCHYTLEKGQQTVSSYDHQGIERELSRRFFAGKPRIQTDTEKYLRRHHQNFTEVLNEVRAKIPQKPLKGSVLSSMRSMLRSFTDVCDAVYAVEIGLRFLGKTGGDPQVLLLSYLIDSLKMDQHISSKIAEALKENQLSQCAATWQLLTCWKSEQMMRKGQDPFQRLSKEFRDELTSEERKHVKVFLGLTDVDIFSLELHEILQLKTISTLPEGFAPHWDIRSTMELHLEEKDITSFPGLDSLPEELTWAKAAEIWRLAVQFKH
ncbi:E3 ubiquitin-protein ligase rnf213-beta isoform X3 [Danio rerio]|uniref:E3 ubiquitin-protein ligase rnf213-beta isoform X3 n=1 Tax=Danio rerio TaxID=7955 RepID=A0AC58GVQ6_DANRE